MSSLGVSSLARQARAATRFSWPRTSLPSAQVGLKSSIAPCQICAAWSISISARSQHGLTVGTRSMSSSAAAHASSGADALATETCVPCRRGAPKLSDSEIDSMLRSLNEGAGASAAGWKLSSRPRSSSGSSAPGAATEAAAPALERQYRFKNFRTALAFANAVGAAAEQQKHHPELLVEWGSVRVAWWTHAIDGLHKNDFVMAARTDAIAQTAEGLKS